MPKKTCARFIFLSVIFLVLFTVSPLFAQKFHFNKYDIQNGLSQSQVTMITQDINNYLLVSTMDGVDKFDGKTFSNFTEDNGLKSNTNYAIYADKKGTIWMAHKKGVTSYDGNTFTHYKFPKGEPAKRIRVLLVDNNNNTWAVTKDKLYRITNGRLSAINVTNGKDTVLSMALDNSGVLNALVAGKGLFKYSNKAWNKISVNYSFVGSSIKNIVFDPFKGSMYLYNASNVFVLQNGRINTFKDDVFKALNQQISCITPVRDGLWIGAASGAFKLKGDQLTRYDGQNGFTYYPVTSIYQDTDDNVWFATNGDGLYSYREGGYLTLDQGPNKMDLLAMAMAHDKKGNVYLGSSGSGLLEFKNSKLKFLPIVPGQEDLRVLNCMFADSHDNLFLGTASGTLWKMMGGKAEKIYPLKATDKRFAVVSITADEDGVIWLATTSGCYYIAGNKIFKINDTEGYYACVKAIGNKLVLAGSNNGVSVISGKRLIIDKRFDFLNGLYVLSIAYDDQNVYFGTFEKGVFAFKLSNGDVKHYTKANGLASNSIYSVGVNKGCLWVGTGRGISRFVIGPNGELMFKKSPFEGLVVECNQNSFLFTGNKVYFGTTKGVFIADADTTVAKVQAPRTVLTSIKIYLPENVRRSDTTLNRREEINYMKLPSGNSHITFNFAGIQLTHPDDVRYKYRLISNDDTISQVTSYKYADFVSLVPGRYKFEVTAFINDGRLGNTSSFSFEVLPAFYETTWFKILMVTLAGIAIFGIYRYFQTRDKRKHIRLERLRLSEQEKVRKQTAEDFHDDLGNKLTRISVLSEILESKIQSGQTDAEEIVSQIKASATEMYAGTKDILWSLNPENDRLVEIINFIEKFAQSFFEYTKIKFSMGAVKGPEADVRLPIGYGRNITMVFKELLNNVVKHANASRVEMTVTFSTDRMVSIVLTDDGIGFDNDAVKSGSGLKNIRNRVKKVDGSIHFSKPPTGGTRVRVNFHIPITNT